MKQRILLPTDFSSNSNKAINYALELFNNESCEFYVLNVFHLKKGIMVSLMNMEPGSAGFEDAHLDSQNKLTRLIDNLKSKGNEKHRFIPVSLFNNTLEAIKDTVKRKDIELIVMGSQGDSQSGKSVYGSNAINVMEKVRNCPTIVVPEKAKLKMPNEIVFATDYKHPYKRRELRYLIEIADRTKANIAVLHIKNEEKFDEDQKEFKKLLMENLSDVGHSFHEISHYSKEASVTIFAESRNSGMISFINKKHSYFDSIFTNALVKALGLNAKVPLLILHDLDN